MNIFEKIKIGWKAKAVAEEIYQEANTMNGTKPGWKTTEFWMNVASQAGILWSAVAGFVPPKWAGIISTSGVALYTIARTVGKAIADVQATRAQQTTVATTQPATVITTPA